MDIPCRISDLQTYLFLWPRLIDLARPQVVAIIILSGNALTDFTLFFTRDPQETPSDPRDVNSRCTN
jgi:hypothetical protein